MKSPNRKRAISLAVAANIVALMLTGCSSDSNFNAGAMFAVAQNIMNGGHGATPPITLQEAASVPYATIAANIGDGGQQMLVLLRSAGSEQTWVGSGNVALVTQYGRLVQTGGLPRDMPRFNTVGVPAPLPREIGASIQTRWVADFTKQNLYSVSIACRAQAMREEAVTILGKGIRTVRVDETCSVPQLAWNYVNTYWVSPASGIVWQSVQHFSPELEPMTIIVLRPLGT